MLYEYSLDKRAMLSYAKKWAFGRDPHYYDFETLGGDCTNFISQCIHAGGALMNFTKDTGWYYISLNDRAAAWTGVEYFYRFMSGNLGVGPFGHEISVGEASPCDVIQLGKSEGFYHSLLVTDIRYGEPYVASHSVDSYDRPLSSYSFERIRCIHIIGARRNK